MTRFPRFSTPVLFLVVACALWGFATVLSKYLLGSVPPITLLVLQLAPSATVLWLIALAGRSRAFDRRALLPLILLGLLNPGLSYTLSLFGLSHISASVATLLWAAEPIMILALAGLILDEPVNSRLFVVMLIGALGVSLVTGLLEAGQTSMIQATGIALMLGAVLCCAIYTVFSRKIGTGVDPLLMVAVQQTAGLAWAVTLLLFDARSSVVRSIVAIPPDTIAIGMLSGLLYYAAAYWLYLSALKTVPAAVAGSFFNLIPLFGIVLAFVLLGERLTAMQWGGALAIVASVYLLLRWNERREEDLKRQLRLLRP